MKQKSLILVDFDGTLWRHNPLYLGFTKHFKKTMKKWGVDVNFDDFINMYEVLSRKGELRVRGDLQKIIYHYYVTSIKPCTNIPFEEVYQYLMNDFRKEVKRLRFKRNAVPVLSELVELNNSHRVWGLTNGYYDFEVEVLNEKLGSYKSVLHDYYTPERVKYNFRVKYPFKPNTEIIESLVKSYHFDNVIMIGDSVRADGLLAKHPRVTTLIITPYNDISQVLAHIKYNHPTEKEVRDIVNLWLEGRIVLVKNWKGLMRVLPEYTNI